MELKIGSVAKMTGLSPSGIRFLEEQGLLTPSGGRKGSYRSFGLEDVSTLLDYRNYRQCGFTQEEILSLIRSEDDAGDSAIFDQRCSALEQEILQATRLLRFLRRRSQAAADIGNAESFCELGERPAIIWMPLKDSSGALAKWPENAGFDIPFADSVLLFDGEQLASSGSPLPSTIGIGILESDVLQASFLGLPDIRRFPPHQALHLIAEVTDDFCLKEESLSRCRSRLQELLQKQGRTAGGCPVISKRIITTRKAGRPCRFDHLWVDIDL